MSSPEQRQQVTVRRTPRLVPFLVGGVFVAFTAAVILVMATPPAENYSQTTSIGYMTMTLSMPAVAAAAAIWLLLERRSRRKTTTRDIEPLERNQ